MKCRLNAVRTLGLLIALYSGFTLLWGTVSFSLWQRHERWLQDGPKRTESLRWGREQLLQERDLEALRRQALHLHQDRESARQTKYSIGDDLRMAAYGNLVVLAGTTVLLFIAWNLLRKERRRLDEVTNPEYPHTDVTPG